MQKSELLKHLKYASEFEEKHTPMILKFFMEDFDWMDIEKEKIERVKKILKVIISQTNQHKAIVDDIIEIINESGENEF